MVPVDKSICGLQYVLHYVCWTLLGSFAHITLFFQAASDEVRNRDIGGGMGGQAPPPLFSEKAVNIINTYTFILGAKYFSPPTFCMLPPPLREYITLLEEEQCDIEFNTGNENSSV